MPQNDDVFSSGIDSKPEIQITGKPTTRMAGKPLHSRAAGPQCSGANGTPTGRAFLFWKLCRWRQGAILLSIAFVGPSVIMGVCGESWLGLVAAIGLFAGSCYLLRVLEHKENKNHRGPWSTPMVGPPGVP